uniref:Uncharacterized protein n=1 Tax=Leviviridae sp. TaxID=2027243 RepID=A0A514DBE0_9VIRU|nr:MAG: hypothetical protein H1Rhizo26FD577_000003 [Leviviridae sp.]
MTRVRSVDIPGFSMQRVWEVQSPPFVHNLPFSYRKGENLSWIGYDGPYLPDNLGPGPNIDDGVSLKHCINNAYDKITAGIGDQSTWGNNVLEAHQSLGMVTGLATSLLGAVKAVRKGDVGGVVKSLGLTGVKGGSSRVARAVNKSQPFANKWLELHFGWVPLVKDIGSAMDTISKPDFGLRKVRGSSQVRYQHRVDFKQDLNRSHQYVEATISCHSCATYRVTNPNAFLANQLGVVNPLAVAWEAVPYSFVVDWFSNVGQVLSSMDTFCGCTLFSSYTTTSQDGTLDYFAASDNYPYNFSRSSYGKSFYVERQPSISGPSLEVKPFKGLSPTRAATAISLLLQKL